MLPRLLASQVPLPDHVRLYRPATLCIRCGHCTQLLEVTMSPATYGAVEHRHAQAQAALRQQAPAPKGGPSGSGGSAATVAAPQASGAPLLLNVQAVQQEQAVPQLLTPLQRTQLAIAPLASAPPAWSPGATPSALQMAQHAQVQARALQVEVCQVAPAQLQQGAGADGDPFMAILSQMDFSSLPPSTHRLQAGAAAAPAANAARVAGGQAGGLGLSAAARLPSLQASAVGREPAPTHAPVAQAAAPPSQPQLPPANSMNAGGSTDHETGTPTSAAAAAAAEALPKQAAGSKPKAKPRPRSGKKRPAQQPPTTQDAAPDGPPGGGAAPSLKRPPTAYQQVSLGSPASFFLVSWFVLRSSTRRAHTTAACSPLSCPDPPTRGAVCQRGVLAPAAGLPSHVQDRSVCCCHTGGELGGSAGTASSGGARAHCRRSQAAAGQGC